MSRSIVPAPTRAGDTLRSRVAPHVTVRRVLVTSFAVILLLAAALRLVGTNWDDGEHLHPDERYMSIVADNTSWPSGLRQYLDVEASPLSPYNVDVGRDYLYGTLPLFATKLAGEALGQERYGELNLVGRRLAALLDTLTVGLVFLIAFLLLATRGRREALLGGFLAAALYAFTVTAIQHAHFFTTDVWLVFFGTLTFLLAAWGLRRGVERGARSPAPILLLVGAALGLTVACKASGAFIALPVAIALVGRAVLVGRWAGRRPALLRLVAEGGTVLVTAYVAFRAVAPYTFAGSNWLDLSVNESFRAALENQARATAGPSAFPPAYQWVLSSRIWSPLENLLLWQLGIPLALAALAGLGALAVLLARTARAWWSQRDRGPDADAVATLTIQVMLAVFVGTVFLYVGTRFTHSGRYLLPIVPFLVVAAAYGLALLAGRWRRLWIASSAVVVAGTALWALAFVHIYTEPNTRIEASDWIRENIRPGAAIANEHWDDAIPVAWRWAETEAEARAIEGYRGIQVPVFDPDDEAKLRKLYDALSEADLYVLSSPRAWNTIGRLEEQFPLMDRYYEQLFAERLGFVRAAEFTSYPELLGVTIDDLRAEEAFWVYDHPPVTIFRREGELSWESFRGALCPRLEPPYCG